MAYKVLYRKYRPSNFDEMVGQDEIKKILSSSVSHAYIFTGPRGTGKTSTAKILAKAINCENPEDGEPCGKCQSCLNFLTTPDIIEIDAASNNGIDEIRELRSNVTLAPTAGKYKIYIIDEVHMLSTGAFNALLKTLEEPPAHAIFILATTEIYKVPITILSRCQRYDFKKIDKKDMIEHLKNVCKEEKINCEDAALEELYSLSEGCMRDALGLLDQLSKTENKITLDVILKNYNVISNKNIEEILFSVHSGDIEKVIETLNNYEDTGMNAQKLIKKIINYLEKIAIDIKLQKNKNYSFTKIKKLIGYLNQCYIDARINENIFSMIKLAFLETIDENDITPKLEKESIKERETVPRQEYRNIVVAGNSIDIRINNCFVEANKESLKRVTNIWTSLDKDKLADIDLSEYKPVASSNKFTIFVAEEASLADLFNIKSETIEKLLKKNNFETFVVAISENRWKTEKENYVNNIKKKYKYEYIEEPNTNKNDVKIDGEITNIFATNLVEII